MNARRALTLGATLLAVGVTALLLLYWNDPLAGAAVAIYAMFLVGVVAVATGLILRVLRRRT